MIIKGKNRDGKQLEYELLRVRRIEHEVIRTDYDKISTGYLEVWVDTICHPENNRDVIFTSIRISLFNKDIKVNKWMTIDGFIDAFKTSENYYNSVLGDSVEGKGKTTITKIRKQFKKFRSKLSDENKLILEVL